VSESNLEKLAADRKRADILQAQRLDRVHEYLVLIRNLQDIHFGKYNCLPIRKSQARR
jgi:hypothetical protein